MINKLNFLSFDILSFFLINFLFFMLETDLGKSQKKSHFKYPSLSVCSSRLLDRFQLVEIVKSIDLT
ncbi:hypothetical protein BpHYR1_034588 [Brachionus plicatilis]|uniref:Uncharacterized protein n=1 Tax=Brachionus plicatilis TaxID=10195 RepID=A0A3M7RFM9_BRAPC|nr:hypothetical protein BpHYR1_034588 [Brachionus plicatilis]